MVETEEGEGGRQVGGIGGKVARIGGDRGEVDVKVVRIGGNLKGGGGGGWWKC